MKANGFRAKCTDWDNFTGKKEDTITSESTKTISNMVKALCTGVSPNDTGEAGIMDSDTAMES